MNKTEKVAFREAVIVVLMGAVINFPLQTFLLWSRDLHTNSLNKNYPTNLTFNINPNYVLTVAGHGPQVKCKG